MGSKRLIRIRALILDMDGVIWHDDQPIGDLPFIFEQIREKKLEFLMATNNATLPGRSAP